MFCIHCGQELLDGSKFCTSCGKPTESDDTPVLDFDIDHDITSSVSFEHDFDDAIFNDETIGPEDDTGPIPVGRTVVSDFEHSRTPKNAATQDFERMDPPAQEGYNAPQESPYYTRYKAEESAYRHDTRSGGKSRGVIVAVIVVAVIAAILAAGVATGWFGLATKSGAEVTSSAPVVESSNESSSPYGSEAGVAVDPKSHRPRKSCRGRGRSLWQRQSLDARRDLCAVPAARRARRQHGQPAFRR